MPKKKIKTVKVNSKDKFLSVYLSKIELNWIPFKNWFYFKYVFAVFFILPCNVEFNF